MVWIAICAAISAVLMQHLGLCEAIAEIIGKIAKCHICCCFWLTLAALLHSGCEIVAAISLSIVMAYLSNYFVIVLMLMQRIYSVLWQKTSKKK